MKIIAINNPFNLNSIRDPSKFFNREREISRTLDLLNSGTCVSIYGPEKIGKTSFLYHATSSSIRFTYGAAEDHIVVRLDGQALSKVNKTICYMSIRDEIIRQIRRKKISNQELNTWLNHVQIGDPMQTTTFGLRTVCEVIRKHDLKVILVFDNFDALAQNPNVDENYLSFLRSLHTNYPIAHFIASQKPLYDLEKIGPDSPFSNIFQSIRLKPWSWETSRDFIIKAFEKTKLPLPESVLDHILELGNNEPYKLQKAGYATLEVCRQYSEDFLPKKTREITRKFKQI